jgi:hypothetical protein
MSNDISPLHKRIDDLISANPSITLQELARSMGIDRHKIESAIQEHYGYGFRELKNWARLNLIVSLLTEQGPRIFLNEIAITVGLTPNALYRFIRSMTGRCARELRGNKDRIRKELSVMLYSRRAQL